MKIKVLILILALVVSILCSCVPSTPQEPAVEHTHSFSDEYSSNETHHWYKCECGEKDGLAEHAWNDGVITIIPTPDSDGIQTRTCIECGRKMSEKISYVPDEPGPDNPNPDVELNGLSFTSATFFKMDEQLPKTPLTLEADIYVDPSMSSRVGAIFGNYMGIRQDWLFEIYENGVPRFYFIDAYGAIKDIKFTEVDVRTGDWVHIAFTYDYANKVMSVYLDGELAQSIAITTDLAADITTYRFIVGGDGRSNNGNYFKGQIKSIAAYSDVRTAGELKESAINGVNSNADDILVHYVLNANSGDADIEDLSPNGIGIAKEWIDSHETTIDYAYSFAVIGDTQWLNQNVPAKMEGIYDWIVANAESKKIAHVMGLGDITEEWGNAKSEAEWVRAQEYIFKLNGVVPYSLIRGNHDESHFFEEYFANDTYRDQFGGYFMVDGDIRNAYKTFRAGSVDYLLLVLDFGASDEMLAWANEVVLAHPNHRVIVTTHAYQGYDAEHLTYKNSHGSGGISSGSDVDANGSRGYNNGQQIWEKFVSKHPNIFLVLSGHTPMEDLIVKQSVGNHGNIVNQMIVDPQWMDPQKGGVGMVCMLYFSEDGSQMEVEWISTDTGKYYQEHNQFVVDLTNSINAPAHNFTDSYNEKSHHKGCECGYIYDAEPHVFDGGVLNADGFMVYTCECGYQRIASATDDPVALALQEMLDKYYNNGVYYKSTVIGTNAPVDVFFNGNQFVLDGTTSEIGSDLITLQDLILGKHGDINLDRGWNFYEGVYSTSNETTIQGIKSLVSAADFDGAITKVIIEEINYHAVIKLFVGDDVVATAEFGLYATTILTNHNGDDLGKHYTKSNDKGMCEIITPAIEGYVAEYDKIILNTLHDELTRTVYYTTVAVWDGKSVSTSLAGSGTQEDPFLIQSGADLAYIAKTVNEAGAAVPNFSGMYFKITQSIDLNGHALSIGGFPSAWAERKGFHGFIEGNHCTIRGLNNTSSLFGTIEGGSLKNLSVYGTLKGNTTIGGIVGYVASGTVLENLTNYVNVTGVNTLGGVVGNSENQASTVKNCVNYGDVTGSSWNIGGIAGSGGHDILGCVNYGNVKSTGSDNVGGIAGSTKSTGTISDCINYGSISTVHGRTGGIVGLGAKPIVNCVNYGKVTAGWDSGGILGFVNDGVSASVINCVNYGAVEGGTGIGGIFGFNHANAGTIKITNCINNGTVTGTWGVGGIAGNTKAEITGCVNNAFLTAKGELGGIVGKCYGKVTECTNNGHVKGIQDIVGGIVGHLHDTTYFEIISTTNTQNGIVEGPGSGEIIARK